MTSSPVVAADHREDHPASSYRRLPVAQTTPVVGGLALLTLVAWFATIRQADSMSTMVMGLGHIGRLMPMGMSPWSFSGMWAVMMVAMMAPTIAPVLLADRFAATQGRRRAGSALELIAGYFSVWWLLGVPYYVAFLLFHDVAPSSGDALWVRALASGIFVLAGIYQFTPRKAKCLRACCRPYAVTQRRGFSAGWAHGVDCLGCCWAAMAVLLVVGIMNVVWMLALTLLFVVEKHSPRALTLSRVAGAAFVVIGVAVLVSPVFLHAVSGVGAESML